jgi:hypothetical protein
VLYDYTVILPSCRKKKPPTFAWWLCCLYKMHVQHSKVLFLQAHTIE